MPATRGRFTRPPRNWIRPRDPPHDRRTPHPRPGAAAITPAGSSLSEQPAQLAGRIAQPAHASAAALAGKHRLAGVRPPAGEACSSRKSTAARAASGALSSGRPVRAAICLTMSSIICHGSSPSKGCGCGSGGAGREKLRARRWRRPPARDRAIPLPERVAGGRTGRYNAPSASPAVRARTFVHPPEITWNDGSQADRVPARHLSRGRGNAHAGRAGARGRMPSGAARLAAAGADEPPRPHRRRHGDRQDQVAAAAGGAAFRGRRPRLRLGRKGRPVRAGRAGRGDRSG